MLVQIASDLHIEFGVEVNKDLINPVGDVLVLAGDVHVGKKHTVSSLLNISKLFNNKPIIYVLGNHEYYGSEYKSFRTSFIRKRRILKDNNIHLLDRDSVIIDNVFFIGATGWTDGSFMKYQPWTNYQMSDLRVIKGFKEAEGGQVWGKKDAEYLRLKLRRNFLGIEHNGEKLKCVVVTHHAPCELSIETMFKGSPLNVFFVNDWTSMIDLYKPELWIHGHIHQSVNYDIYDTNVVCNPSGYYMREPNPRYNHSLTVNI